MKKIKVKFLVSITICCFFSCIEKEKSTNVLYNLSENFSTVEEINLDTTYYSGIKYVDISDDGSILITNENRSDVSLYDSVGGFLYNFSNVIDSLSPGINWKPNRAFFMTNEKIFISNNGPWGLIFDRKKMEVSKMPKSYMAGFDLAFDDSLNIYSFNSNNLGIYISKYDLEGKVVIDKFGYYPEKFKNVINKAIIGNSMVATSDNLFVKNIAEAKIYKYDLRGELIDVYEKEPTYYRRPKKDVRTEPLSLLIKDIRNFAELYTANYSIHKLNENNILVQYSDYNYEYGIQILNSKGNFLLKNDLLINEKVIDTQSNFIYTISQRDYQYDPNYLPKIKKYRFSNY